MEMVSAAKMRRAVEAALNTRKYATLARELMEHLAHVDDPNFELLKVRPVKNILVLLVSSNRGLCGSFNSSVFKKTKSLLGDTKNIARHRLKDAEDILPNGEVKITILGVGKKSVAFARQNNYELTAVFDKLSDKPYLEDILPISEVVIEEYVKGTYDKVVVAYTDYKSSLVQEPKMRQLLPISPVDLEKMVKESGKNDEPIEDIYGDQEIEIESYLFEPSLEEVVEYVLPRLVETQIYQAILESSASEHSARMVAMRSASDAAGEMIDSLNLSFNKARQAAITQEIAEIAGGAAALG